MDLDTSIAPVTSVDQLSEQMNASAVVSDTASALAGIRLIRVKATLEKKTLKDDVSRLLQSREGLLDMFVSEVNRAYPELVGIDIAAVLDQVPDTHPIALIWAKYEPKVFEYDKTIASRYTKFQAHSDVENKAQSAENAVMAEYSNFVASTDLKVPPAKALQGSLVDEKLIPMTEEVDLADKLTSMDLVSPDVAMTLMTQAMPSEEEVPATVEGKIMTMKAAENAANQNPQSNFKTLGLAALVLGLAYTILGGE